eukprot:g4571.t1
MSKRALLVGCNYPGTMAELRGCVNDVFNMKSLLEEFFSFDSFSILIDNDESYEKPTGQNIKRVLRELVSQTKSGDALVMHFSGHGTQVPSDDPNETDMKDEAIVPTDMNLILDDDLRNIIKVLPQGATFTFISDCCHSGGMLDHTEVQIEGPKDPEGVFKFDTNSLLSMFGLREANDHREITNRSLPTEELMKLISSKAGTLVNVKNVRNTLSAIFGEDVSTKVTQYLSMAQGVIGRDAAAGCLGKIMSIFTNLLGGGRAQNNKPPPTAPKPGQKPPPDEQLSEDVGVLITGCQSHETSADACPGGDSKKAYGALSHAIQTVVKLCREKNPTKAITNKDLVFAVRKALSEGRFSQNPCLECSARNADSPFITG